MKYYKEYPIVPGKLIKHSSVIAKCPYCANIEHFTWNKSCTNPTRRRSHCIGYSEYYYIYIPKRKEVKQDGRESNV